MSERENVFSDLPPDLVRIYVAGPMTGLPEFNYPAFHAAADSLRKLGYEVANPADNEGGSDTTWQDWIRLGLAQLLRCQGVALLDDWHLSKGATLEVHVARTLDMPVRPVFVWLDIASAA